MKKTLLYVLLASLALVFVIGCGEKKKDDPLPLTPVNVTDLSTLKGTYEVQAFLNETSVSAIVPNLPDMVFAYKCEELKAIDSSAACDPAKDVQLASQAVISGDSASNMVLETKIQMAGGSFADAIAIPGVGDMAKMNAYNYTKYGAVRTYVAPSDPTLPPLPSTLTPLASATGVSGRNMNDLTSDNTAEISFFLLNDGRIIVTSLMTVNGLETDTAVILKKINDTTPAVNPNELVNPTMANFDATGFKSDLISGTYTVSFFGTQVTNAKTVADSADFILGSFLYISNDCAKAMVLYPDVIDAEFTHPTDGSVYNLNQCDSATGQSTLQKGVVAVEVKDGKIHVTSKMEMNGGSVEASVPDKYQFTTYAPVNFNGEASVSGTGVKGFNYDNVSNTPSATETDFATTPFNIAFDGAGNIDIAMTLVGKQADVFGTAIVLDAVTRVQATKTGPYAPLENRVETDLTAVAP